MEGGTRLGYRPELDGLRAISVAAVFAYHAMPDAVPGGWVGVDVFFVVSGFLITRLLCDEHERGGIDLRSFWMRRGRRLMPASLLVIAVAGPWVEGLHWVVGYSANWAEAFGHNLGPLTHLWSLAVEEQFYVVWPLVLVVLLSRRVNPVPVVLSLIGAVTLWRAVLFADGGAEARVYFAADTRADALLIGCLLAFTISRLPWHRYLGPVAAVGLCLVAAFGPPVGPGLELLYTPIGVAAAALVLWALHERPAALRSPLMLWVGVRSYGIYLWHWPILWAMHRHGLDGFGRAVVAAVLTAGAAAASYRWIEIPMRNQPRRWAEKNGGEKSTDTSSSALTGLPT